MPPVSPNSSYEALFGSVSSQGSQFEGPLSPSNQYLAFLSKVDLDDTTSTYDVMFEVVAMEWAQNALLSSSVSINAPPPAAPALIYHIPSIAADALMTALGVNTIELIAEGSWYLLTLEKTTDGASSLYDPDIDQLKQS